MKMTNIDACLGDHALAGLPDGIDHIINLDLIVFHKLVNREYGRRRNAVGQQQIDQLFISRDPAVRPSVAET